MKKSYIQSTLFLITLYFIRFEADCETVGSGSALEQGLNYVKDTAKNVPTALVDQPENKNSSIKYHVYSPRNPKEACFLEPNMEALRKCPIDPKIQTIFLIHGFIVVFNPGYVFGITKDLLLANGAYNVILVDWSKYDGPPYELAIKHMMTTGSKVADLIKYLEKHSGVSTDNITIIGHSLGAHMAGVVGKHLDNLNQIIGLDPAGPHFETPVIPRLSYTDANFVKVVHTSNEIYGLGLKEAIGHMDFYVNGGERQPHCHYGAEYCRPSGDCIIVNSGLLKRFCHHEMSPIYYLDTINSTSCDFLGTECSSYTDFKNGKCPPGSSAIGDMGFYGKQIPDLPPLTKFYLRTRNKPPYCLENGYKAL